MPYSWTSRSAGLLRAAGLVSAYGAWLVVFRLMALSAVTFMVTSSSPNTRFDEIAEIFSANEIPVMGVASALFLVVLKLLHPIIQLNLRDLFSPERFEKNFIPGFLQGMVLASGIVLAFLLSGTYRYLGFYIQFDEAPLAGAAVAARVLTLGSLAYCEEYLFRSRLISILCHYPPFPQSKPTTRFFGIAILVSLLYCGIKCLQFDLGVSQFMTLFVLSFALSTRALLGEDFAQGAGLFSAMVILFHALLSLPIFGSDFMGIVLVKYQGIENADLTLPRLLSGGAGGPFSSIAFQFILLLGTVRGIIRYRKKMLLPQSSKK